MAAGSDSSGAALALLAVRIDGDQADLSTMLLRFLTPHAHGDEIATWVNPEQVAGVHSAAPEVATIYLVGGFEQRVIGRADEVARRIEEAQRALRPETSAR